MVMKRNKLIAISLVLLCFAFAFAACSKKTYTVTFSTDGGSAIEAVTVKSGEKVAKPSPDPTKTGYNLVGWYKEAELTNEWKFDTDTVSGDITLYAKWSQSIFAVTFEENGGSAVADVNLDSGAKITKPADPTKTGFVFRGWFKEAAFTNEWKFDTDTVTANTTLYAKWLEAVNVTYKHLSGQPDYISVIGKGEKETAPADPAKKGYIFDGWYTINSTGTGLGDAWDFNSAINANTALFATWAEDDDYVETVEITDPDDLISEGYTAVSTAEQLDAATSGVGKYFLTQNINLAGYTWNPRGANFSGEFDGNGYSILGLTSSGDQAGLFSQLSGTAVIKNLVLSGFDVTGIDAGRAAILAAVVTGANATPITVTIDNIVIVDSVAKGGQNGSGLLIGNVTNNNNSAAKTTLNISNITVKNSQALNIRSSSESPAGLIGIIQSQSTVANDVSISNVYMENIEIRHQSGTGGAFGGIVGTFKNAKATKLIIDKVVMNDVAVGVSGADWVATVIGRVQGNSTNPINLSNTTISNIYFMGSVAGSNSAQVAGITASDYLTNAPTYINVYLIDGPIGAQIPADNVIPVSDEGAVIDEAWWTAKLSAIKPSAGWVLVDGMYKLVSGEEAVINQKVEFTLNLNYADAGDPITLSAFVGNPVNLPAPYRRGFEIEGWYFSDSLEFVEGWNAAEPIFGEYLAYTDTTLYAKWTASPAVTVTFNENGATTSGTYNTSAFEGQTILAPTVQPQKTNYVFMGWFTDDGVWSYEWNFTTSLVPADCDGEFTLYAKWIDELTVAFDPNGGNWDSNTTPINIKVGQGLTIPANSVTNPTKSGGFTFGGWWTSQNSGVDLDAEFILGTTEADASITLYAKWIDQSVAGIPVTKTWTRTGTDSFFTSSANTVGDVEITGYTMNDTQKLGNNTDTIKFTIPSGATNISVKIVVAVTATSSGNGRVVIKGGGEAINFRQYGKNTVPTTITWPNNSIGTGNTSTDGTYSIYLTTGTTADTNPTIAPYLTFKTNTEYTFHRDSGAQALCELVVTYDMPPA